ncbi:Uncharacterised protein [Mycobacteroides abscessus subsp. massiliense]|nr:Uncharacterised protein [Mycobacteroides abscessus subsp. massiliense]SKE06914.1 Uncharacterised protein [Mycobacteroides abscessus subsp. massiliense]SKE08315.1 Uncharacterised protein [Mycobacteroides abscessus subsp. massiliense]SKE60213.1 Uncharacterised protein [Mycobacteroides abscessus subsp. massiliense]SKE62021.1 Uncharacterised protein [Mycobacteroides abscessus subsp. massiliense]
MTELSQVADALLPCFKCGKTLLTVLNEVNQPLEGTEFRTYGHYGSTFWDSFDGTELLLNICDVCLREHANRLATQGKPRKQVEYQPISPYGEMTCMP